MRKMYLAGMLMLVLLLAACNNDDNPEIDEIIITDTPLPGITQTVTNPPTQIVMVVTAPPPTGVLLVPVTFTPTGYVAPPTTSPEPLIVTATPPPGALLVPVTFTPEGSDPDEPVSPEPAPSTTPELDGSPESDSSITASPPTTIPAPVMIGPDNDSATPPVTFSPIQLPTTSPTQPSPTPTPVPPTPTPHPPGFPTDTVAQVQMAEQVFEHGRMFWFRHNRQIWVMQANTDDPNSGNWFCYFDTFEEGQAEFDPDLIPPTDTTEQLYQPRRGFGKLWRENAQIQNGLGWATTPEFELTSDYVYVPGGQMAGTTFTAGPGTHHLRTLDYEEVLFYEVDRRGDCMGGTWRLIPNPQ
ncbi:MAG: hypothetical protein GYB65_19840 [Chloroflexi bacterium]|nr:hypothetical protein [Chloroflexota bacterium]